MAHAIQLALAPVFLLTGIAGILNVLAARLARIVDRTRQLTESDHPPRNLSPRQLASELECLERRRHLCNAAIAACTISALMICLVIVTLFLQALLELTTSWPVGVLFAGSTVALVVGLAQFVREIQLASAAMLIPSQPTTAAPDREESDATRTPSLRRTPPG